MSESNYILGQVIARGGMAEVYRGLHVGQDGFRRLVAIKRILPQFSSNSEFADMFRDEAHIGQRLQHANVVKVECFSIIEQCPSIVMEFVDGSDLRSILSETERSKDVRRIPIAMALYITAEAARGLHYAHTRKDDVTGKSLELIHRDISPQNILVSYNGEVKVTDFGIASAVQDFKHTETKTGIVKGKYSYMSPEQITAKKLDARADVFALSIVLWEMLSMRRLFSGDNEIDVIEMVKSCRIPARLSELNKEVSEDLERLVMRGLSKDPNKRFSSMDELERAIRSLLNKEHPNFTVNDLGSLLKKVLVVKHEASQQEIKKMLTSTNLRTGQKPSNIVELELTTDASSRGDLTVSRTPHAGSVRALGSGTPSRSASSQRAPSFTPKRIQTSGRKRENSSEMSRAVLAATAIAVILFGAILLKAQSNAAKDALSVHLKTEPKEVQVEVNKVAVKQGRFIRTPQMVRLEPGVNILEITRPGYKKETVSIDTRNNDHRTLKTISLTPVGKFLISHFVLVGKENAAININDGFSVASLTHRKSIHEVRDLREGQQIDLQVSENQKPSYRCRLTVARRSDGAPFTVLIDPSRDRCDLAPMRDRGKSQ